MFIEHGAAVASDAAFELNWTHRPGANTGPKPSAEEQGEAELPEAESEHDCPLTNREQAEVERLVARHEGLLRRLCGNAFSSREDMEDLRSNVVLTVCRKWRSFNPRLASFATWLGVLIRSEASAMRRKREREPACVGGLADDDTAAIAASARQGDLSADRTELELDRLNGLPAPYRRAFSLVALLGMSSREAAGTMGTTESTIRTYVWRARRILQGEGNPAR